MCGITGIFGREVKESELKEMLNVASRRGPERADTKKVEGGVVGHTLLAFVNEGNNPQPHVDEDGKSTIVYNGEVYNWQELNSKYNLKADTDTATLLKGLKSRGIDFLKETDSQFAFVAQVQNEAGKLETIMARDKWGISPLVFGKDQYGRTVVGSTPEAIVAGGVNPTQIKTLPAGSYGKINEDGSVKVEYWFQLPNIKVEDQKDANIKVLRAKAIASVESRIPEKTDILYTAMGGMDSQFITATIARKTKGAFGGAVTVVPWNQNDPTNKTLGDYKAARTTIEMLEKEGIKINHQVIQMTPEYIDSAIDRVMNVLGPDYFNVCCGLAEDLVATTVKELGGKAIATAGGPDEAGRSYKPMTLKHRNRLEEAWHGICDQFASSEGVRAGLVLGEHGLENRVPLAFLIEESQYIKPEQKLQVDSWGDEKDPFTIKQREKIFFRDIVRPYLPEFSVNTPKDTVHGATGTKPTIKYLAENDKEFQADKPRFFAEMERIGWDEYVIPYGDKSPFGNGPAYCLWRWAKTHKTEFEAGAKIRYYGKSGHVDYSSELADKIERPVCHDHMLLPGVRNKK
jgi:asparagine synthetase B (glutamine-hydrolysing)